MNHGGRSPRHDPGRSGFEITYVDMANILIVEDSSIQAEMLRRLLAQAGYTVRSAHDGAQGYAMARESRPDLVISDVTMPVMDGFELCQRIREDATLADLPVILLTAMGSARDVVHGLIVGADNYVTKPYDSALLLERIRGALGRPSTVFRQEKFATRAEIDGEEIVVRAGPQQMLDLLLSTYSNALAQNRVLQSTQDELAQFNTQLETEVERKSAALLEHERKLSAERELLLTKESEHLRKLHDTLLESVGAIAATVEMRDPYTSGHQRRVADLAVAIGRKLGCTEDVLEGLHIASVVHDLGKIRIPAEILSKPGRLDNEEFNLIKTHARASYDILKNIHFPWPIADIVHQHHERLDGSGYPLGLKGQQIIPEARILIVADVVESMSTPRPYRHALGLDAALQEIEAGRGKKYDSDVVDACLAVCREGIWTPEKL